MAAERCLNILFLCTGNSCRSIMAEALLNHFGEERFHASSAGSTPAGQVNPLALKVLRGHGIPADGFISKSWDVFAAPGAPEMDIIITVCDNAAGEICPVWPGQAHLLHWGLADPYQISGPEVEQLRAYEKAFAILEKRVKSIVALGLKYQETEHFKDALNELVT